MRENPNIFNFPSFQKRFWRNVKKTKHCWLYVKNNDSCGYGMIFTHGIKFKAHRVSYAMHNGPIPDGKKILHHCDSPPCIKPIHLFMGTQKDNVEDCIRKGRFHGKLMSKDIPVIRNLIKHGIKQKTIAFQFNVNPSTIGAIVRNINWRNTL